VQRGQLAVEVFYDAVDALLVGVLDGLPAERPAWRKAYELLRLPRLDRVRLGISAGGWCMVRCGAMQRRCLGAKWPAFIQELQAEVCCSA
jgi:hypothetical protein